MSHATQRLPPPTPFFYATDKNDRQFSYLRSITKQHTFAKKHTCVRTRNKMNRKQGKMPKCITTRLAHAEKPGAELRVAAVMHRHQGQLIFRSRLGVQISMCTRLAQHECTRHLASAWATSVHSGSVSTCTWYVWSCTHNLRPISHWTLVHGGDTVTGKDGWIDQRPSYLDPFLILPVKKSLGDFI